MNRSRASSRNLTARRGSGQFRRSLPWLLALLLLPASIRAQCPENLGCGSAPCRVGARPVPESIWQGGRLSPTVIAGDNTDFDSVRGPWSASEPIWSAVDIEGGYVFAAINLGLQIWDVRNEKAGRPWRERVIGGTQFPFWNNPATSHFFRPIDDVDASSDGRLVAVAGDGDLGVQVFGWNPSAIQGAIGSVRALYADHGKVAKEVYVARIGPWVHAFVATQGSGLLAYNLSSIAGRTAPCVEQTPAETACGAYVGRLGSGAFYFYLDGTGDFLAASSSANARGVEIWNVASPATPALVIKDLTGEIVTGVALWQRGSSYFLALRTIATSETARIYDLSCLSTGRCESFGRLLWSRPLPRTQAPKLTISTGDRRDYLHIGSAESCSPTQVEWLYDVTLPTQPVEVGTATYWQWYYRPTPTGFNGVAPRMGKVSGQHFYRAAGSIFDVHRVAPPPPPRPPPGLIFADGFESGNTSKWR